MDNSATTRCSERAKNKMVQILTEDYGNPSSLHNMGKTAEDYIKEAKEQIAKTLRCDEKEIVFTSGGTESNNMALIGGALANKRQGKHIITTAIEHASVQAPLAYLKELGYEITELSVDHDGIISLEELRDAVREDTVLVSIMMVNNESGAVMPIERMARLTHRVCPNALFHTDAVQGFFKVPFRARTLGADLISVSAHKVHGIKGVGALYIRPGLPLPPFVLGGGQESGLRSGTEGLPAIAAFAAACRAALPKRTESIARQRRLLTLAQELLRPIDGVQLLGAQEAPHILNLAVPGVRSQGLINALQERDIYVSAGSACSKGHRSHVLEAMGVDAAWIDGSVRVSLSDETTEDDIRALAEALPAVLTELRGGGRRA